MPTEPRDGRPHSLEARLDPRRNSLNFLRLFFASAVILSHAWPLGGFGSDPAFGGLSLGGWAVAGFFVISGYLIARSRRRSPLVSFVKRRFLRVIPGLWACLAVTTLLFLPLTAVRQPEAFPPAAHDVVSFAAKNGALVDNTYAIPGTLENQPFPGVWNGSLWTLKYEIACYAVVALLLGLTLVRRRPWVVLAAFAVTTLLNAVVELGDLAGAQSHVSLFLRLATFFLAGSALEAYADRIRLSRLERSSLSSLSPRSRSRECRPSPPRSLSPMCASGSVSCSRCSGWVT